MLEFLKSPQRTSDVLDRMVFDYIAVVQHFSGHVPADALPSFVWLDVLLPQGVSRAAKSPHVRTEIASWIFNMASVAAESGAVQSARAATADDMKAAMTMFRKAAGMLQLLENNYADESIHDFKVAHLAAMRLMMLTGATHCTYLMQTTDKLRTAVAKECYAVYSILAAELRPYSELPPQYITCAVYYAEYFKQSFWLHKGALLRENSHDTDMLMEQLGSVLAGVCHCEGTPLPKAPEGSRARSENFTRISDALYDNLKQVREWLSTENRKVYRVPVPKEVEQVKLPAKRLFAPLPIELSLDMPDPLKSLPDHRVGTAMRLHTQKQEEQITLALAHVSTTVSEMQKKQSEQSVASLLSRLETSGATKVPESLAAKIKAMHEKQVNPPQSLHDQVANIATQRDWCKQQTADMQTELEKAERGDVEGFAKHGQRWYLSNQPFRDLPETIACKRLVTEYQEGLTQAFRQDSAVAECVKQEFPPGSLLEKPLYEHEEQLKQCKQSQGASLEMQDHLKTLDGLVKAFDQQCEGAQTLATQLEEQAKRRRAETELALKALPPGAGTADIEAPLEADKAAVTSDIEHLNRHLEAMEANVKLIAENAERCSGLTVESEKEAESSEEMSSQYIQRLDNAVSVYTRVEALMGEGQQFYASLLGSTQQLQQRVNGLIVAASHMQNELNKVLCMENQRSDQIRGDAQMAQTMHAEEKESRNQTLQSQIQTDAAIAQELSNQPPPQPVAPVAPVVYDDAFANATAPSAPPAADPRSQPCGFVPPRANPYMTRWW
eukprot:TRINITY_DN16898_c0_g1_i1.p1 TRINITY_DN16898_c0_g1~~TRINITY_DN16898_c0_g1_i1.p1  ORF type:complete len:854 (+),score=295.70 TRINITY_DN16898_c0_g1_i1:220-2562(+)